MDERWSGSDLIEGEVCAVLLRLDEGQVEGDE